MPWKKTFVNQPSIIFAVLVILLSSMLYLGSEGLSALQPDHWLPTIFYSFLSVMVFYTLAFRDRDGNLGENFLVRTNIFLWFSATILSSRLLVRAAQIGNPQSPTGQLGFIPFNQIWIGGYHIHHYVLGIALIILSNMILLHRTGYSRLKAGVIFGAGLGLLFDEIGFLLSMGNYSSLITYPAALLVAVILFLNTHRPWKLLNKNRDTG